MEIEIWKDVVGYEGLYVVSNLGRIKNSSGKLLKPTKRSNGYLVSNLTKGGIKTQFKTHRLVCEAFIDNNEGKPLVNHINGIKDDNRVVNLEWCTYSENTKHAISSGLKKYETGKRNYITLSNEQIEYIRKNYIPNDKKFGGRALAREFKVTPTTISNIANGKRRVKQT
jgi:NUMOD4 motif/HNH endonuclease